jgi:hypothetical protein
LHFLSDCKHIELFFCKERAIIANTQHRLCFLNESIWVNRTLFLALTTFGERERNICASINEFVCLIVDEKVCAALIIYFFRSKFLNCTDIEAAATKSATIFFLHFFQSHQTIVSNKAKKGNILRHMHDFFHHSVHKNY